MPFYQITIYGYNGILQPDRIRDIYGLIIKTTRAEIFSLRNYLLQPDELQDKVQHFMGATSLPQIRKSRCNSPLSLMSLI